MGIVLWVVNFALLGVFLNITTLKIFKVLIGYKDDAANWPWYKKYPYGLAFLYGFLADVFYNVVYAGFYHVYLVYKSCMPDPWKVFFPNFSKVTKITELYEITFTQRIQDILDTVVKLGREQSPLGIYAYQFAVLLNDSDPGHITIPLKWRYSK